MPPRRSPRLVAAEKKRAAAAALGEGCCTVRRLLLTDKESGDGVVHPGEPEDTAGANSNYKYFVGNGNCSSGAWTKCVNYDECKSETCSKHGNNEWCTDPADISAWMYIHTEGKTAIDEKGYWFDKKYDCCGKWICGLCLPSSKFYKYYRPRVLLVCHPCHNSGSMEPVTIHYSSPAVRAEEENMSMDQVYAEHREEEEDLREHELQREESATFWAVLRDHPDDMPENWTNES